MSRNRQTLRAKCFMALLAWLTAAAGASAQSPIAYRLKIAAIDGERLSSGSRLNFGNRVLSMNDVGAVVFGGLIESTFDANGFRSYRSIGIHDLVLEGSALTAAYEPSVNNAGQVVFGARFGTYNAIATNDRILASTRDQVNGFQITRLWDPVINNLGQSAFKVDLATGDAIFLDDEPIVTSGDVIDGLVMRDFSLWPSINDSGTVAFMGQGDWGRGIFTQDRIVARQGDLIDGLTLEFIDNGVSINNAGEVVFLARFGPDQYGLFTQDKVLVKTGDVIDGRTLTFISERAEINDAGEIVFTAAYDGGVGVFTRDTLIASVGDIAIGRELVYVGQSGNGANKLEINNRGEIAIYVHFPDGHGILVAIPVPEPGSIGLVFTAAACVCAVGWFSTQWVPSMTEHGSGIRVSRGVDG